jgi:hypothetical protein
MYSPTGYVAEYQDGTVLPVVDFVSNWGQGGISDGDARVAHPEFGIKLVAASLPTHLHGAVRIRPLRNGE